MPTKNKKSKKTSSRKVKDLPAKALTSKQGRAVKGGGTPTENISFNYGKVQY